MRITEEQKSILDSFRCERLSSDKINKELIRTVVNSKGRALVAYLQALAWDEDVDGKTAFYVIKNSAGDILLFFSLKCGALFEPLDEKEIQDRIERFNELLEAMRTDGLEGEEHEAALQLIERLRSGLDIPLEQFKEGIKRRVKHDTNVLQEANADREQERNGKIVRVGETYPGVELVHFCSNDNAKAFWQGCGISRPMGEVLFWRYITPIIFNIQTLIGCQYLFLFAADTSPDRLLVNYYEVALHFLQPANIGTNKPRYDFRCEFMCQKTNDLRQNRDEYFANFNTDIDEDIV